ncbi:MAG: hypothetical protein J2P46_13785, partial [Zavarzinella sp.]|nr:hypothetical protein [Zavarzinella sp.]
MIIAPGRPAFSFAPAAGGGYITQDRPRHPLPPRMSTSSPPTRVRYAILSLLCVLAMVTYMDRAANGSAKRAIMADLNENQLSTGQK